MEREANTERGSGCQQAGQRQAGTQDSVPLPQLCVPPPRHHHCRAAALSPCALQRDMDTWLESCSTALLELWPHRRGFMSGTPQPWGQRLWWVGEEARGLAQRKGSALEGIIYRVFWILPTTRVLTFSFLSFPDPISAAWRFSSWEVFPCAMSFPVSTHRPHPNLCALTLALHTPACLQGTGWVPVPVWRFQRPGQDNPAGCSKGDAGAVPGQRSG